MTQSYLYASVPFIWCTLRVKNLGENSLFNRKKGTYFQNHLLLQNADRGFICLCGGWVCHITLEKVYVRNGWVVNLYLPMRDFSLKEGNAKCQINEIPVLQNFSSLKVTQYLNMSLKNSIIGDRYYW